MKMLTGRPTACRSIGAIEREVIAPLRNTWIGVATAMQVRLIFDVTVSGIEHASRKIEWQCSRAGSDDALIDDRRESVTESSQGHRITDIASRISRTQRCDRLRIGGRHNSVRANQRVSDKSRAGQLIDRTCKGQLSYVTTAGS